MIDTRLTFVYAGKDSDVVQYYFSKYGMEEILEDRKLVSREESQRIQSESDLLLLLTYTGKYNEIFGSIVTGKIYEYLLCNVPILVIGQENWELAPLIRMKHGSSLVPNREENIYAYLVQSIRSRKSHRKETDEFRNRLRAYSYETISSSLVEFLEFQKQ